MLPTERRSGTSLQSASPGTEVWRTKSECVGREVWEDGGAGVVEVEFADGISHTSKVYQGTRLKKKDTKK